MYDDHYGLRGRPFQLTPDPRFWFDTATHKKAMAYLGYGLSQGEGFIVITGEPGTGKTTLLGHLMDTLDRERLNVIRLVSTQLEAEDLLRLVAAGLEIDALNLPKSAMLAEIERGLHAAARAGKRTLLIVDESQALPVESLEELRMLSNFQAGGYPLLQIFLIGQPEFRQVLQLRQLEQLRQRVIAMHHLEPMEEDEVEPYIIHRLSVVGWRGKPRFTNNALAMLYRWSGGNPRRLNTLAGRVMLFGAIERIDSFTGEDVEAVITDLDADTPAPGMRIAAEAPTARAPLPITPTPPEQAPAAQPAPTASSQPVQAPEPQPAPPVAAPQPAPRPVPTAANESSDDLSAKLARIEARLEEQDEAMRRILTLLVDWVENDTRKPDLASLRGNAA